MPFHIHQVKPGEEQPHAPKGKIHHSPTAGEQPCYAVKQRCQYNGPILPMTVERLPRVDLRRQDLTLEDTIDYENAHAIFNDEERLKARWNNGSCFWDEYRFTQTTWDNNYNSYIKSRNWGYSKKDKDYIHGVLSDLKKMMPKNHDEEGFKPLGDFHSSGAATAKQFYETWMKKLMEVHTMRIRKSDGSVVEREMTLAHAIYYLQEKYRHQRGVRSLPTASFYKVLSVYMARLANGCSSEKHTIAVLDKRLKGTGLTCKEAPGSMEGDDIDAIIKDDAGNAVCYISIKCFGSISQASRVSFHRNRHTGRVKPDFFMGYKEVETRTYIDKNGEEKDDIIFLSKQIDKNLLIYKTDEEGDEQYAWSELVERCKARSVKHKAMKAARASRSR